MAAAGFALQSAIGLCVETVNEISAVTGVGWRG